MRAGRYIIHQILILATNSHGVADHLSNKKPPVAVFSLFLSLFMSCSLSACCTKLFKLNFALYLLLVFSRLVISIFTILADKVD
jgi:hypothetical protein